MSTNQHQIQPAVAPLRQQIQDHQQKKAARATLRAQLLADVGELKVASARNETSRQAEFQRLADHEEAVALGEASAAAPAITDDATFRARAAGINAATKKKEAAIRDLDAADAAADAAIRRLACSFLDQEQEERFAEIRQAVAAIGKALAGAVAAERLAQRDFGRERRSATSASRYGLGSQLFEAMRDLRWPDNIRPDWLPYGGEILTAPDLQGLNEAESALRSLLQLGNGS